VAVAKLAEKEEDEFGDGTDDNNGETD